MGLEYGTLSKKPIINLKDREGNNVQCIDLLPLVTHCESNGNATVCTVNKYYVGRPDLISLAFYGEDKFADVICKINGISNPFELNEDDILVVPSIGDIDMYTQVNNSPSELITDKNTAINKTYTSKQKNSDSKRSPNEQNAGASNYIVDRSMGLIFY